MQLRDRSSAICQLRLDIACPDNIIRAAKKYCLSCQFTEPCNSIKHRIHQHVLCGLDCWLGNFSGLPMPQNLGETGSAEHVKLDTLISG